MKVILQREDSYTSMPLVSVYSDIHSGRPLERVPRLASAHRAALARPSATPHKHPPECPRGALHRSRRAAVWSATQTSDSCSGRSSAMLGSAALSDLSARHTCARRLREAPSASSTRTARLRAACLWREGRLQPQPPLRLSHEHASSRHTQTFIAAARSSAPRASLGLTMPL